MIAHRIADARHPIFDPTGAMLQGGRWNSIGQRVIYAAESYAGAMLEVLVHANLSVPPKNHRVVRITIPETVEIEILRPLALTGWDSGDLVASRRFGDTWLREKRTAVLQVPSVITEGRENNILINPLHPQFLMIHASQPEDIRWDVRLFGVLGK
jgi:RES domain-containing protein